MPPTPCTPTTSSESSSWLLRAPLHGEEAEDAGDGADGDRFHRLHVAGGRRDGDESGDGAGGRADDAGLAGHATSSWRPTTARRPTAAVVVTVKALTATAFAAPALPALKPNQPNQRMPAPSTIIVMSCGSIGSLPEALARAVRRCAAASAAAPALTWMAVPPAKSRPFTSDGDPAFDVEHPVRDRRVDQQRPGDHEDQERSELRALGEGARDQGRRDDGEHELEDHEQLSAGCRARLRVAGRADALQPEVVEVADDAPALDVRAEGQRVADDDPERCRRAPSR